MNSYDELFDTFAAAEDDDFFNDDHEGFVTDQMHFERVCAEFAELIEDYGTTEVFKELPDGVVFDIVAHLEDIQR